MSLHKAMTIANIQQHLTDLAKNSQHNPERFFKIKPGSYAEHDKFLGIPTPQLRALAKLCMHLTLQELQLLLQSPFNEERLLSLIILTQLYKKGTVEQKLAIYTFYLTHISYVNNWNLVDTSAHLIVGAHIFNQKHTILYQLAQSNQLWKKRIAIVATWHFIRNHHFNTTLELAKLLLKEKHDLIAKALGWMLREVGKRDTTVLIQFLDNHAAIMQRITLVYALEKFEKNTRTYYLNLKIKR